MKKCWRMQQTQKQKEEKTLDIYFYDDIESDGKDWWGDKIRSETSANTFLEEIRNAGELERINVHINSFGGSCKEGNAIANNLRRLGEITTAYIDGFACSAASVIACACHTVVMPRNTVMFIHNPWEIVAGNAAELRKEADDLEKIGEAFSTIYEEKSKGKISRERLKELMDAETYLTAEECHQYGFCDYIERFDAEITIPETSGGAEARQYAADPKRIAALVRINPKDGKNPEPEEKGEEDQQKSDPETGGSTSTAGAENTEGKQDFAEKAERLLFQFFNAGQAKGE